MTKFVDVLQKVPLKKIYNSDIKCHLTINVIFSIDRPSWFQWFQPPRGPKPQWLRESKENIIHLVNLQ